MSDAHLAHAEPFSRPGTRANPHPGPPAPGEPHPDAASRRPRDEQVPPASHPGTRGEVRQVRWPEPGYGVTIGDRTGSCHPPVHEPTTPGGDPACSRVIHADFPTAA